MSGEMVAKRIGKYEVVEQEHKKIANEALAVVIRTDVDYQNAGEFLLRVKAARKEWAELIKPAVSAAHQAHKQIKDLEKKIDRPLEHAETRVLKPALSAYYTKKEEERKAEEERINKELRDKAEAEAKARADNDIVRPDGQPAASPPPPAPTMQVVLPKEEGVKGISYTFQYSAYIYDTKELLQAVLDGKVSEEAVLANMGFLNGRAKLLKENFSMPGVKVVKTQSVVANTARR